MKIFTSTETMVRQTVFNSDNFLISSYKKKCARNFDKETENENELFKETKT